MCFRMFSLAALWGDKIGSRATSVEPHVEIHDDVAYVSVIALEEREWEGLRRSGQVKITVSI